MTSSPIAARIDALAADFDFLDSWEDRIAHILDLGRQAAPLAEHERSEAHKVRGCASQVWIVSEASQTRPGALAFRGQSDASIVQGLVTLLTQLYSDATPDEILEVDAKAMMERLHLADALTAQRANGLVSMLKRIRAEAEAAR